MTIPAHLEKCFEKDVDGYVYYWPDGGAAYAAHHLREIADELDRRNKDWDEQVQREIGSQSAKESKL